MEQAIHNAQNSSRRILVFVTKKYPYPPFEQYVDIEVKLLSKLWDHILIYPIDQFSKDAQQLYPLPENVQVISHLDVTPAKKNFTFVKTFLKALLLDIKFTPKKKRFEYLKSCFATLSTQYDLAQFLFETVRQKTSPSDNVCYYTYWLDKGAICLSILKHQNKIDRFISRAHSIDLYHEKWGIKAKHILLPKFREFKLQNTDLIVPISKHGFDHLERIGISTRKLKVGYLGVADYGLNPETQEIGGEFIILSCSKIDENKRVWSIAEALNDWPHKTRWIHIGSGSLRQKVKDSLKSDLIQLELLDEMENKSVREFLSRQHVDVFINVSVLEGLPVSIMESLSHGIPIIATAVNGTPEAVIDSQTGFLIPVDFQLDDMRQALDKIRNHKDISKMRGAARAHFEARFDASKNYTAFSSLLLNAEGQQND